MEEKIKTTLKVVVVSKTKEDAKSLPYYLSKYGYKTLDAAYDGSSYIEDVSIDEILAQEPCEWCDTYLYYMEDGYTYPVENQKYCSVCGKKLNND